MTVLRSPSSGSATERELPDVFAGDGRGNLYAIEAKSSTPESYIYVDEQEVVDAEEFSGGLHPETEVLVAVRWDGDTQWYYYSPEWMYRTDGGNYRASSDDFDDPDVLVSTIEDLLP